MRSSLLRNIRPMLPVIVGLVIGASVSIWSAAPLSTKDCIRMKKDHFERHLSSLKGGGDDQYYSDEEVARLGYKPMKSDEAERYRNDRVYAPPVKDSIEDFEPRIIMDPELKPKVAEDYEKNKKVVRPRLLKTELGIRERLVCAILTNQQSLPTMGVAMNRTFSHHMQNVLFFTTSNSIQENEEEKPQSMNLVTIPTTDPNQFFMHVLQQLHSKFSETHDWFYIAPDSTYTNGHQLNELVDHISINRRLYMGRPQPHRHHNNPITYCDLKGGILISRLLFIDIFPHLSSCKHEDDVSPDKWFASCIKRATRGAVDCTSQQDGMSYKTSEFPKSKADVAEEDSAESHAMLASMTVSGVSSPRHFYLLHKRMSEAEIDRTYQEILQTQEEIKSFESKLPADSPKLTWPIGINPPFRPTNRWDIIPWDYFTEDYTLTCPGEIPRCELNGIDKIDVQNILQVALKRLNEKYNPQGLLLHKKKLINGYRRYDPQRGMEYVLDILLNVVVDGEEVEVNHRVDLLRPLTQAEIVPMPFVTESAVVNVIVSLTKSQRALFAKFMDNFAKVVLQTSEKASLTVVFIYDGESAANLRKNDIFADQKKILNEYEVKYKKNEDSNKLIPWISIKTDLPSQLKMMDIESKKYSDSSLLFITSPSANINSDFLNRCRMNTIKGWQAFFPIPFSQYNPDILYKDGAVPEQIEIKPVNGHFDIYSFDEVCIYNSDYHDARNLLAASISSHQTQLKMSEASDMLDIYDLLVKYSQLHLFRAVEPQLIRRYSHRTCDERSGDEIYHRCVRSNSEGLASRSQLAMQLFPED